MSNPKELLSNDNIWIHLTLHNYTAVSNERLAIYLVMEYLNGGDCATLLKVLGTLGNEWAKRYVAEVVVGVDDLHKRGIIHRDLKPDNLVIDSKGHLKLRDFGLSRLGVVGRQTRAQRKK